MIWQRIVRGIDLLLCALHRVIHSSTTSGGEERQTKDHPVSFDQYLEGALQNLSVVFANTATSAILCRDGGKLLRDTEEFVSKCVNGYFGEHQDKRVIPLVLPIITCYLRRACVLADGQDISECHRNLLDRVQTDWQSVSEKAVPPQLSSSVLSPVSN